MSTPPSEQEVVLPFKFTGGLALSTKTIGYMLAVQGFYSLFAQLCLFPFMVSKFKALRTLQMALWLWPPIYFAVPYLILLPKALQIPAAYVALLSKITLHVMCFPAISILLANTITNSNTLGSVNGLASSVASLSRALGPSITGFLHSQGIRSGYSVIAWWALGIVCIIGATESLFMEDTDRRSSTNAETAEVKSEPAKITTCGDQQAVYAESLVVSEEEAHLMSNATTLSAVSEPVEMIAVDDKSEKPSI